MKEAGPVRPDQGTGEGKIGILDPAYQLEAPPLGIQRKRKQVLYKSPHHRFSYLSFSV